MNGKKLLGLTIALLLAFSSTIMYAGEDDGIARYSMEDAIGVAHENNLDLQLAKDQIEAQELNLDEAERIEDRTGELSADYFSGVSSQFESIRVNNGYYVRLAEMGLKLAEEGLEAAENMVECSVKNAYYDVLYYLQKYDVEQENYDRSKRQYEIAQTRLELGTGTRQELLNAESQMLSDELEMQNALSDLYYSRSYFNNVIGMPQESWFELEDDFSYDPIDGDLNMEELFASAKTNRFTVVSKQEAYEVAKLNYEITRTVYTPKTYKGMSAYNEKEAAYNELVKAEKTAELGVRKAYVDMVKAYRSIEALDKSVEALSEAYRLTMLSYEVGMATIVDVMNAQSALNELELGRLQAVKGYNLARMNFEFSHGVGLPY